MGCLLFVLTIFFLCCSLGSCITWFEFVYPNFTASNLRFIDNTGSFLFSRNGTFKASMFNPGGQHTNFYLCIIHVASNTIIWSANRDSPVSDSGKMILTVNGIAIADEGGTLRWSTPPLKSPVSALKLTEMGNLMLLDRINDTLWESFHYPTDTIVIGQKLPVGTALASSVSSGDLSTGNYRLLLSPSDAILQWRNSTYWTLSMDPNTYRNSNYMVEYMAVNRTGLDLFGQTSVVIRVNLPPSNFRIARLDSMGQFVVSDFSGTGLKPEMVGPVDKCRIPLICGGLGLCNAGDSSGNPVCSCPSNFGTSSESSCLPSDDSFLLPKTCNSSGQSNSSMVSYVSLGYGVDYFANYFSSPVKYGVKLSACEDICTPDCSCSGIFFENSSGSCYVVRNEMGSFMLNSKPNNNRLGFVKTLRKPDAERNTRGNSLGFPVAILVILPLLGFLLVVSLGILRWKISKIPKSGKARQGFPKLPCSDDLEDFSIPGLPIRFEYRDLAHATLNFKVQIGSGGFGTVYKGVLPDRSLVAVKKITNIGSQGTKDFCTEIAVIGNIHHVNLVKLRGFCAQGRERILVYEYMNHGSLDRTLFGNGPVLEWQERVNIALGTARGLAYLHHGCQQKIIHCDVKPENILLHENFQAKISDFGLSKLLSSEQSGLFTTMRGTRGYLAPEWLTSSTISDKTDVYSFGMVLLEIVSGRKNCAPRTRSHSFCESNSDGNSQHSSRPELVYFPLFALEMHEKGKYLELCDPRLEGRVTSEEAEKLVRVALCCVQEEPGLRPSMVVVVGMLEGGIPVGQPRLESLNFLRFYGRRFSEASTIEENNQNGDYLHYPEANASATYSNSGSSLSISFISSQQVSGPR